MQCIRSSCNKRTLLIPFRDGTARYFTIMQPLSSNILLMGFREGVSTIYEPPTEGRSAESRNRWVHGLDVVSIISIRPLYRHSLILVYYSDVHTKTNKETQTYIALPI